MDLVRDLLDKAVIDRNGRDMGRVDTIVVSLAEGGQPRVVAFEIGPAVAAYRLGPVCGRWAAALEHAFAVDEGRPLRIRVADILGIHDHVKVDVAFGETSAATVERRLRQWIGAIPGSF
jgi:hypothetical protein